MKKYHLNSDASQCTYLCGKERKEEGNACFVNAERKVLVLQTAIEIPLQFLCGTCRRGAVQRDWLKYWDR